jgi:NodT family efflux transporter outer membrane factor (OMF) lipoprotein
MTKRRRTKLEAVLLSSILLSACAVGPDYQRPDAPISASFKEAGDWKVSAPQKVNDDPTWWSHFNDPLLDQMERQVTVSSQTILQAEAAYRSALAAADSANAALFPTVSVTAGATRAKQSLSLNGTRGQAVVGNDFSAGASASWALDVWGKLRRSLESAQASAEASNDQLAAARLTIQAALASDYFSLRGADELQRLLDSTVVAYDKSLTITRNQYRAGTAAKSDVDQAITQLESTRSQALAVRVTRSQLEHAIAVLLGKAPANFSIAVTDGLPPAPELPIGLPSALLERRPDVAVAERQMASANALIGVAIAAYFPDLTLSAATSNSASTIGNVLRASNNVWSFGPSLAETIVDWGARDAQVAQARANYDVEVANYRQTVLTALQQVEDDLISISQLTREAEVEERAVTSASEAERLITNQYRAGTVAYTSVVTAQTAALTAKQSALTIHQSQLTTLVALLQALGGGWQSESKVTSAAP